MKVIHIDKRGNGKMATQLQPTPTLHGQDARAVLDELNSKPTPEQIKRMEDRKRFFQKIGRRGSQ